MWRPCIDEGFKRAALPTLCSALLSSGFALLFLLMTVEPSTYRLANPSIPTSNTSSRQSTENTGSDKSELTVHTPIVTPIRVLVRKFERTDDLAPVDTGEELRRSEAASRVALNIILRSGYLDTAEIHDYPRTDGARMPYYVVSLDTRVIGCLSPGTGILEQSGRLAIAAVAIEKFHRNIFHRYVERWYARIFLNAFGHLPDISLGPAQLKATSLRRAVVEGAGDRELLARTKMESDLAEALADECTSLQLAKGLIEHFSKTEGSPGESSSAMKRYSGARRSTNAVIDYATVASRIVEMIEAGER